MSNVVIANYPSAVINDTFEHIWKLTRAMKAAGYVTLGSSNGTLTATGSNAGDLWGSASNPLTDIYPSNTTLTTGSWIIMQGPSTLKIGITSSFTGSFIRGENLSQTETSATGELIGCNLGSGLTNGYLVVGPRVSGSSTGSLGWNLSGITSSISTISFTPTSLQEYVREFVFWRGSAPHQGAIYYQCVLSGNVSGSSETRFSQLTGSIGCTTASAPGGGGSGNGFPTNGSLVALGTGGANTPANWFAATYTGNIGNSQILCIDATGGALRTMDGTFNIAFGLTTLGTRTYSTFGFNILDNTENGDVDPYVFFLPTNYTRNSKTRTVSTSLVTATAANGNLLFLSVTAENYDTFLGFRRRGFASNDSYMNCMNSCLWGYSASTVVNSPLIAAFTSIEPEGEATSLQPKRIKEPCWVVSHYTNLKMRKGTLRWLYYVLGGSAAQRGNDTLDGGYWFQLNDGTANSLALILGPYDGSVPING